MRLVNWNVNGLRAVHARNDLLWAFDGDCDVVCLQETKIQEDAVTYSMRSPKGWRSWWAFGKKKGYSGTAIFVRDAVPVEVFPFKIGRADRPDLDEEGRIVGLDFGQQQFVLLNVYFPNGASSVERFTLKRDFHERFLNAIVELTKAGRS